MIRSLVTILCSLFICFVSVAQQMDIQWSKPVNPEKKSVDIGFVGNIGEYYYKLRKQEKVMFLSKHRISDMQQVWEKSIQWNDMNRGNKTDKNLTYRSFRKFDNHFVFFFEDYNNKDDIQRLFAQKINFDGDPVGDLQEVGSRIKQRRSKDGEFSLSYSPDSTKFLVTTNPYYDKYSNEKFEFEIFDKEFKLIGKTEITLPFRDKDFSVESFTLSNKNDIYVTARVDVPKKDRSKDDPEYFYEIIEINPAKNGEVKQFDIRLDQKYVSKVDVLLDKNGRVKCFGLYSKMNPNGKISDGIHGLFYFTLTDGGIKNLKTKEFDADFVKDIEGKRRANKEKGLESHFQLKYFLEKPDGGAIILAEEQYTIVVTTRTRNGGTTTTYHYHNNSILVVNIGKDDDIKWYAHIPKKQHTTNINVYNSFYALYEGNKTYILFNDHKKNAIENHYEKTMRKFSDAVPVLVTISEGGKTDKKIIHMADKFVMLPRWTDKMGDNKAFLYSRKVRKGGCGCSLFSLFSKEEVRYGILEVN